MLFRKKIERSCAYCTHGTRLEEDQVLCARRGMCKVEDKCLWFRYDPVKRIPPKPKALDFSKYDEEDYSL